MKRPASQDAAVGTDELPQPEWRDDLKVEYVPNGKKTGTVSGDRYKKYSRAKTVAEALKRGATRADLNWDYKKKLLKVKGPFPSKKARTNASTVPRKVVASEPLRAVKTPGAATSLRDGVRLPGGGVLPVVGFGTYKLKKGEAKGPVLEALKAGYRLIDTAQVYENEGDVGEAIRQSGVPRSDICIMTKVWRSSHGYDGTMKACHASLKKLGVDYIDLYVIHWPGCKTGWPLPRGTTCPKNWKPNMRDEGTWRAMEQLYKDGKVKAIGVTNYSIRHLKLLLKSCKVKPMINQVEFHPRLVQTDLMDFCKKHGIFVQAFASLGSGDKGQAQDFFAFPPVKAAAQAHKVRPAQVLLRWALEKGCGIVPKSVRKERVVENANLFGFKLKAKEIAAIDSLHTGERFSWSGLDPDTIP